MSYDYYGLKPDVYDKNGPGYKKSNVDKTVLRLINSEQYFNQRAKNMTVDAERAIKLTEEVNQRFSTTLDNFQKTTENFKEKAKSSSGAVRDAADKLSSGLLKMEKAANFDSLERYVGLLERAAKAMTALSELENSGKLEKISHALK